MDFLLVLQQFRQTLPDLSPLYFALAVLASGIPFLFFFAVYYWLFNKRGGLLGVLSFAVVQCLGQTLKTILCIYRPWVLDSRIVPESSALEGSFGATGYSCPSLHSASSTTVMASFAIIFKKHRWVPVVCVLTLLLFCFSRMFLGVHTPLDIALGVLMGLISMVVTLWCMRMVEKRPSSLGIICLVALVFSVAAMIYTATKSYPMEYVNGVLLVDPEKIMVNTFEGNAAFLGAFIGWFIEERFVHFSPVGVSRKSVLLTILGLVVIAAIFVGIPMIVKPTFGAIASGFVKYFLMMLFGVGIWPIVLKRFASAE